MATAGATGAYWTWHKAWSRTREVLRQEGVRSLWFKLLGETVYRRLVVLERPVAAPLPTATARLPVDVSRLQQSQIVEYLAYRPEAHESTVRAQLDRGDRCFVVRHHGRVITTSWLATGWVWEDYVACAIPLAPGEVYQIGGWTTPAFRGHNVFVPLAVEMIRYCRAAGYQRMLTAVWPENRASLRVCAKIGYRPYGRLGSVTIGAWTRHFYHITGCEF